MANQDKLNSRHHWISQFLLRRFQIVGSREEIYFYKRSVENPGDPNPDSDYIREVAQERGFNTLTSKDKSVIIADLEDIFSTLESSAAPVVEKLNSGDIHLSDEERTILAVYIGILASANPKNRRLQGVLLNNPEDIIAYLRDNRENHIDGFVKARPDLPDARERMERYIDNAEASVEELINDDPKALFALTSFHLALEKAELLFHRKWELVTTSDPNYFIISDHPVIALPPSDNPTEWEDKYWELPLVLPISPYKALHLIERNDAKEADGARQITAEHVVLINNYSMFFAEDEVYSHTNSDEIKEAFSRTIKGADDQFFI